MSRKIAKRQTRIEDESYVAPPVDACNEAHARLEAAIAILQYVDEQPPSRRFDAGYLLDEVEQLIERVRTELRNRRRVRNGAPTSHP